VLALRVTDCYSYITGAIKRRRKLKVIIMTYLTREEIKETLEAQFKEVKVGGFDREEAEGLIFSEDDICDCIEPNSSNYLYAREMQHEFINFNF